jgi:hypothetical protein
MADAERILDDKDGLLAVRSFWKNDLREKQLEDYRSYLKYYQKELNRHDWCEPGQAGQPQERVSVVTMTIQDVINVTNLLSKHRDLDIVAMKARIKTIFVSASGEEILNAIDFVLRVWLTLNVRSPTRQGLTPHTPVVRWDADGKLWLFLSHSIVKSHPSQLS